MVICSVVPVIKPVLNTVNNVLKPILEKDHQQSSNPISSFTNQVQGLLEKLPLRL